MTFFQGRNRTQLVSLLLAVMVTAGCALNRGVAQSDSENAAVQIENRGWVDMTIYVVEGGVDRRRLGVASATGTSTFILPPDVVRGGREIQFLADPVGTRGSSISRRIFVRPGETVVLSVQP